MQAKARLNKAKQDVARYEALAKMQAIPQQKYDDATAAVEVAEAEVAQSESQIEVQRSAVERVRVNLGYTEIRSPITGIAGRRQADPGNLVGPESSTHLVTISQSDPIRVSFDVNDAEYLK